MLAVFVFHANSGWLPGGFVGVDIFFVISGFLITDIVLRRRGEEDFSLSAFFRERITRILPAYIVLLAVIGVVMAILLIPRDFGVFHNSLLSALLFNSNSYFASQNDYFAPASHELPLLHTWSLAVEMKFYLILPLVLIFTPRRLLPMVLGGACVALTAVTSWELLRGPQQTIYFSTWARVPEFLIGSLLALGIIKVGARAAREIIAVIGLSLILSSAALLSETTPFPGCWALPACVGTALIIATPGSMISRFLSLGPAVPLGNLSYSIYLWHWPVLAAFRYWSETYVLTWEVLSVVLLATLALSFLSYRLIEIPFMSRQRNGRYWLGVAIVLAVVLTSIATAPWINMKLSRTVPAELTRYAPKNAICHGRVLGTCDRGIKDATIALLLTGDSHAAQLNFFADQVGQALGVKFDVVSGSNCVPIPGFDLERIRENARRACEEQIAEVVQRGLEVDGIVLAGKWSYHTTSQEFLDALSEFLAQMQTRDVPVLLLSQVPMMEGNVIRALRFSDLGLPKFSGLSPQPKVANDIIKMISLSYTNTAFLDLSDLEVFNTAPFFQERLIYMDSHHLNEFGSQVYGLAAIPALAVWLQSQAIVP